VRGRQPARRASWRPWSSSAERGRQPGSFLEVCESTTAAIDPSRERRRSAGADPSDWPDLLTRPRHGRIRLLGRWIHFPLRAGDLALRTPPRFGAGVALDLAAKLLPRGTAPVDESFATVLRRGLGRTICEEFYFPYARKVWGLAPEEMSPIQARRRVSSGSIAKMLKRLLPGGGSGGGASTKGVFYYPRGGFGQISEALAAGALEHGARLMLSKTVTKLNLGASQHRVELESPDGKCSVSAESVWSTLPIPLLARVCEPAAPPEVITRALRFRAMLLSTCARRRSLQRVRRALRARFRITSQERELRRARRAARDHGALRRAACQTETRSGRWARRSRALVPRTARSGIPVRANVRSVAVRASRLPASRSATSALRDARPLGGEPAAVLVRAPGPVRPRQHASRAVHGALCLEESARRRIVG
jgi:hypothetical protein